MGRDGQALSWWHVTMSAMMDDAKSRGVRDLGAWTGRSGCDKEVLMADVKPPPSASELLQGVFSTVDTALSLEFKATLRCLRSMWAIFSALGAHPTSNVIPPNVFLTNSHRRLIFDTLLVRFYFCSSFQWERSAHSALCIGFELQYNVTLISFQCYIYYSWGLCRMHPWVLCINNLF